MRIKRSFDPLQARVERAEELGCVLRANAFAMFTPQQAAILQRKDRDFIGHRTNQFLLLGSFISMAGRT